MKRNTDSLLSTYYPESNFGGFSDVDGTVSFYLRVNSLLRPDSKVLDFGCGRGAHQDDPVAIRAKLRILTGEQRQVIGLDRDLRASTNPFVDVFMLSNETEWPIESESVDLCLADCVLEHLEAPDQFFVEVKRVLRPGGHLCLRTTNLWGYVALVAQLAPTSIHQRLIGWGQPDRQEQDIFKTTYRCNTVPELRETLSSFGFKHAVYTHSAEPEYLNFSSAAYWFGKQWNKHAPDVLGTTIFVFGERAT
jgi:SAM-dependent methyltransferase